MCYRKRSFIVAFSLLLVSLFFLPAGELAADDGQPYVVSMVDPDGAPFPPDIPPEDHYVYVLPGHRITVGVHLQDGFDQGTGAFDLLLCYDRFVLNWVDVVQGEAIADWEFFTYRTGIFDEDCDSVCPSGYIRLIGIRDLDNDYTPPAGSEYINGLLSILTFEATADRSAMNICARIGFCSIECGDNVIADVTGNEIALAFPGQDDPESHMITFGPDYNLEACLVEFQSDFDADSFIYFDPGYVCIIPLSSHGDINLNGIDYEIGDAVLFSNYFIYGPGVWDPIYYDNQILATDVNDDGVVLTVADLVALVCIIANSEGWYFPCCDSSPKHSTNDNIVYLDYALDEELIVSATSPVDVGAAAFVFRHDDLELGTPILTDEAGHMTIGSSDRDNELRVLVCSMESHSIAAGEFEMFTVPASGAGTIELIEVQFSDAYGNVMEIITDKLSPPDGFELWQNYPNPFNAATTIRFALPVASEWALGVYDIIGRKIEEFTGHAAAGRVAVEWDATDAASGMYFYKLAAGKFTDTRKMVLMK
jgi:hypothetical protein